MENCISPVSVWQTEKTIKVRGKFKTIREASLKQFPCGKCPLCKHSHRMNWLMRCQQESKHSQLPNHWFITLTYNEKKVPRKQGVRTLYKRHPQLFLKRLRKAGFEIKYILVGEYGSETSRPHYHMLCWTNATITDIDKAWSYGNVHYRKLERETILYTLKYVLNPRQGDNELKQKEYAVYSKGIGLSYMDDAMYRYHTGDYENPIYYTVLEGKKIPLPRYYRKKIFTKYQNSINATDQYFKALKTKMRGIRKLKEYGYRNPWKEYARLKHYRAAQIVKNANLKKQKI